MTYPPYLDDDTTLHRILDAMERYGGSFVSTLAQLTRLADPIDRRRLLACFADYYVEYYHRFVKGGLP